MLNRRQLRIKVMQALYGHFQNENQDPNVAVNNLLTGNERSYDLYLHLLQIFVELAQLEQTYKTDAPARMVGKSPFSFKFTLDDCLFVKWLKSDANYNELVRKRTINWTLMHDDFATIYFNIRQTEEYKNFISTPDQPADVQIKFLRYIFENFFDKNDTFKHNVEERNIYWAESFDLQAHFVYKTLDGFNSKNFMANRILPVYKETEDDIDFVRMLFLKTVKNNDLYTKMIAEKTQNWEVDRIAVMDVILLKMALCEILELPNIPVKVTMNEYLDISKVYSTPKSNAFINGIIDNLVIELREQNKIVKTGRGLVG